MNFRNGERARIIGAAKDKKYLVGAICTVVYVLDSVFWSNPEIPHYHIDIDGIGPLNPRSKKRWSCPEYFLEKLSYDGWEKVSWDSIPWKPKELVS